MISNRSHPCRQRILGFALCCIAVLWQGCYLRPRQSPLAGAFYLDERKSLEDIGRVALIELDNLSHYPEISEEVSEELFIAMQRIQAFSLTRVDQSDPHWKDLQLEADMAYNNQELTAMRNKLKCNAVISGMVTEYRPYPHLTLGIRLNLVDLRDGAMIWGVEHIWSEVDVQSPTRVSYYLKTIPGKNSAQGELLKMSSKEFIQFAAFEIAETLSGYDDQVTENEVENLRL